MDAIKSVKGFKDIVGFDAEIFSFVEKVLSETASSYGYNKIILPIVEHTELFARSVGEETDIVEKEMYTFSDKSGRSLTLRPEMTASAARSYIENHFETFPSPFKVSYFGPCFRYENPQKGRYREFYQFGVEAFGDDSPVLDAEVISIAFEALSKLNIKGLKVKVNSIGCKKCRPNYRKALVDALKPHYDELCEDCKRRFETNPMRILDCKKESKELKDSLPKTIDYLCDDCKEHFEALKNHLSQMGIPYEIDNTLVRGLDYYTRTVFEVISEDLGAQNALLGGGRYDYLIEELGGRPTPGVGFAIGVERLLEVMKTQGFKIENKTLAYIAYQKMSLGVSLEVAKALRDEGFVVLVDTKGGNIRNQIERSAKRNASFTIIIGESEMLNNTVQIKNMSTKEQREVPINNLIKVLGEWQNA
ncbi:MAG: histidine--tRNA ligase [Caldisericaceae bacterium]